MKQRENVHSVEAVELITIGFVMRDALKGLGGITIHLKVL